MIHFDTIVLNGDWTGDHAVPDALVARGIEAVVQEAQLPGRHEVSVAFSDDAHLRELNARFRGIDRPTNVLSFPSRQIAVGEVPDVALGDIVLALETCAREAAEQGKTFADHVTHLLVHGLLHLFGHDHDEPVEAEAMEALERRVLARLGIADPYRDSEVGLEETA